LFQVLELHCEYTIEIRGWVDVSKLKAGAGTAEVDVRSDQSLERYAAKPAGLSILLR